MQIEKVTYTQAHDAMHEAMEAHWDEVPFGPYHMPLNLDHEAYVTAEQEGYAQFYLVYVEDAAVAYMSVFASQMMQHKGEMLAVTDAFYVAPAYRKGGVFAKLLKFVEHDLQAHGIRFFTVGTNPMYKGSTEQFLDHVGYCKTEVQFTKELTE